MNMQGDRKYRAPEINEGFYTPTTDMYTLGIIFDELFDENLNFKI